MDKIEAIAWRQSEGVITEDECRAESWRRYGWVCQSLYTDDALQAVAEAVLSKVQKEINKYVILDDDNRSDYMFNMGLNTADAIVGDFDIVSLINQLKGQ